MGGGVLLGWDWLYQFHISCDDSVFQWFFTHKHTDTHTHAYAPIILIIFYCHVYVFYIFLCTSPNVTKTPVHI